MQKECGLKSIRKWALLTAGFIALGMGILGVFLPLLPTTPFLLLSAACFFKSSPRMYRFLLYNPWFGKYIRNYREGRGIPLRVKVVSLSLLWGTILYAILFVVNLWTFRLLLFGVAMGVTIHIVKIGSRHRDRL